MLALMTIGPPGAGKTTWVKRCLPTGTVDLNLDDFRLMVLGDATDQSRIDEVLAHRDARLREAALAGLDVVLSDTNLSPVFRDALQIQLSDLGYGIQYILFDTPLEVCLTRNAGRDRQVPEHVIRRLHGQYLIQHEGLLAMGAKVVVGDSSTW